MKKIATRGESIARSARTHPHPMAPDSTGPASPRRDDRARRCRASSARGRARRTGRGQGLDRLPQRSRVRQTAQIRHRARGASPRSSRGTRTRSSARRDAAPSPSANHVLVDSHGRSVRPAADQAASARRNVASTPAGSGPRSKPASPSAHIALRASDFGPIDAVSRGGPPGWTGSGPIGGSPSTTVSPRQSSRIVATCSSSRANRRANGTPSAV